MLARVWRPHAGQGAFLRAEAPYRTLACGRWWGKTDACAADLVLAMLREERVERAMVVAPTLDQARIVFERTHELLKLLEGAGGVPGDVLLKTTPHPRLHVGPHTVTARSAHRPRSLRGYEATHIVVDEAAYISGEIVQETLAPMLATTEGRLTLVSTPHGRGHFFEAFRIGQEGRADHWSHQAPSSENPRVSARFLAAQREMLPVRSFEVEYEAAFHDVAGTVFAGEDVDAALGLALPLHLRPEPVVIGVDWARVGDATAFVAVSGTRDGARVIACERHFGTPWIEQRTRLVEFARRWPGSLVFADATGLGSAPTEIFREELSPLKVVGVSITPVVFTPASKDAMVTALRLTLERRRLALLPDPELVRELHNFAASITPSGGVRYAASHGHDDLVCALMLAVSGLGSSSSIVSAISLGARRNF